MWDLFSIVGFMQRGGCHLWSPDILIMSSLGNLGTFVAYMVIPALLLLFLKSKNLDKITWRFVSLFGAFVLCCGIGHLLKTLMIVWPAYRLEAVWDFVTMLVSIRTMWVAPAAFRHIGNQINKFVSYRDLVEEKLEGHWEYTLATEKVIVSKGFIASLGYEEFPDGVESTLQLLHPDDREATGIAFQRIIEHGGRYRRIHRFLNSDDEYVWRLDQAIAVYEDGKIVRILGMNTDVSDLVESKERLLRAHKERDQFTFIASHDLKEPIRAMMMSAEVAADPDTDDETRQEFLAQLVKSGEKGMRVVDSFVKFAKIGVEIDPSPVDMGLVVKDAMDTCRRLATKYETEVAISIPDDFAMVRGEHALLIQVLENVIGNAIKFSSKVDKPIVAISAAHKYPYVEISVSDNGIGIAPDYLDRVGEACYRLNSEAEFSGSGLGLTLVKKIVEAHRGSLTLHSKGEGKGTEVRITLPQHRERYR